MISPKTAVQKFLGDLFFSKNDRKFGKFHVFVVFGNFRVRNEGVIGIIWLQIRSHFGPH